jgi:hypothetical protein
VLLPFFALHGHIAYFFIPAMNRLKEPDQPREQKQVNNADANDEHDAPSRQRWNDFSMCFR